MYNVECITDEVELAAAKVAMDQSGKFMSEAKQVCDGK